MFKKSGLLVLILLVITFLSAQEIVDTTKEKRYNDLFNMSFDELKDIKIVSASKKEQKISEASATITVITSDDIELSGAICIPDLLRNVAGLDVMSGWDNNIDVGGRGLNIFQNSKFLVLLDGQRLNNDYSGSVRWKEIPVFLEDIERIEVITSPLSALYGANSFGGMINIITKSNEKLKGLRVDGRIGEKETQEYHIRYSGEAGKLKFKINTGLAKTEGWGNRDSTLVEEDVLLFKGYFAKLKDWSELYKTSLKMEYPFSERSGIILSEGFNFGKVAMPNLQSSQQKTLDSYFHTKNWHQLFQYYYQLSENSDIKLHVSSVYWKDEGDVMPSESKRYDSEVKYSRPLGNKNYLVTGIFGENVISESPDIIKIRKDKLYGFYLQNEFKPISKINVTCGLRYDKHTELNGIFSPRITFILNPIENHYFRFGAGSAFRKPSILENYYYYLSPDSTMIIAGLLQKPDGISKPEKIVSYNFDYQNTISKRFSTRINLFRNDIKDIIMFLEKVPYLHYNRGYIYENTRKLSIKGVEVEIRSILTDYLQCYANTSYQKLKYQTNILSEKLSVPEIKGNLGLLYKFKFGLFGNVTTHYVGKKETQLGNLYDDKYYFMQIDSYITVDLNLAYNLKLNNGKLQFAITCFNILDNEHLESLIWDGGKGYFGLWSGDSEYKNYDEEKKRMYENRNALHDRKILVRIVFILF
ncbi:MAG: TonB-dependent receptor [Bacteroidales bacterium]|nr:TonB-dependent receptor [Bacteroidales bacterium]